MALETLMLTAEQRFVDHIVQSTVLSLLIAFITYVVFNEFTRSKARVPGMGGPKGLPLIGNLWDIRINAAEKYEEWSKTYGDVYQVQMGNVPVVVVNSAAATKTLWMTHSQALASRPTTYTFHKIASSSAGLTIGTSPYDDSLKRRKKGAAVALNRPAIQSYVPYLDMESKSFIEDIFTYGQAGKKPIDPLPLIQRLSLSLAVTINWGVRVPSHEDRLFKEIVEVEEELNRFRSTTGNLQDYIPLLRLNPFNKASAKAREMRDRRDHYLKTLNNELSEKVAMGSNKPCIQANVIKFKEETLSDVELISISLSVLGGGFETVSNTVQFSMAFLAQHPEIQDKAYREIQEFQGSDDPLCDAADDQKCAYVNGLAKEALRYFTVIPLNLPRQSTRDIDYNGVRIPEGTTFYMNAMACNWDHELWDDPEVFRPERWIEKPDATVFTFGLGYRMCAGHLLASRELYLVFMRLLSSFRLESHGTVDTNPRTGMKNARDLIMAPERYEVLCVPRNEDRLRQALADHKVDDRTRHAEMRFSILSVGLLALVTPLVSAWSKEDHEIFRLRDEIMTHEGANITFYDFVGVTPSASQDEIKRAYRKKSKTLHPDKVKAQLNARTNKSKNKSKPGVTVTKPPTQSEIKAAIKAAGERQTRLGVIANILTGPERARYDHFMSNGFPTWKGTGYYYSRYRPGLGTVLIGVFLAGAGGFHYIALYMGWKRQREFIERYIKFARHAAWGDNLGIAGVDAGVTAQAPTPEPAADDEQGPMMPTNRKQRREQERMAKKESAKEGKRSGRPRGVKNASGSATPVPQTQPSNGSGPTGAKKRVVAENGKILVVDSLGDVYLEQEDEDGNVQEFLLDPNEVPVPTIRDTALVRLPVWAFRRILGKKDANEDFVEEQDVVEELLDDDSDIPQRTPSSTDSNDDFELLDATSQSVQDLAKVSGSKPQASSKAKKRSNKKR